MIPRTKASKFYDLPVEVLLESIFPYLHAADLTRLAAASRALHSFIHQDDLLWKRRLQDDFGVLPESTGWTSRWSKLYPRFHQPSVLAWRQPGRSLYRHCAAIGDGYSPVELKMRSSISEISACASAFHALDANGDVYVWGMLNGTGSRASTGRSPDFSNAATEAHQPSKLALPRPTAQLTCGRVHSAALDVDGRVWNLQSWGRPFAIKSPLMDCSSPPTTPRRLQCGSGYTSALMASGDVLIWYPLDGEIFQTVKSHEAQAAKQGESVAAIDGIIPCQSWEMEMDAALLRLPSLPTLPDLAEPDRNAMGVVLDKLYGTWKSLIGVTNQGHVVKIEVSCDRDPVGWTYLPHYSDHRLVRELLGQTQVDFGSMTISTHSNRFIVSFGAGATAVRLLGYETDSAHTVPRIIPDLGNGASSTITSVQGDHLTGSFELFSDRGGVFTWEQTQEDEDDDDSIESLVSESPPSPAGSQAPWAWAEALEDEDEDEHESESVVAGDPASSTSVEVKVTQRTFGGRKMFCRPACSDMSYTVVVAVCLDEVDDR